MLITCWSRLVLLAAVLTWSGPAAAHRARPQVAGGADTPAPAPLEAAAVSLVIDSELLVAGSEPPPGLTAIQREARERDTAQALAELEGLLADPNARARCVASLSGVLAAPEGDETLFVAAANAAGTLGLRELTEPLASALEGPPESRQRAAADRALHRLYGVWFEDAEDARTFAERLCECDGTDELLDQRRDDTAERRILMQRLLPHEPARAEGYLSDRDPLLRADAARVLGQAVRDGVLAENGSVDALFARLAVEPEPAVRHALFGALLDVLAARTSETVPELRASVLDALSADVEARRPATRLSLAGALARLASIEGEGAGRELRLAARILEDGDSEEPDVLVGILDAVRTQSGRLAGRQGEWAATEGELSVVHDTIRDLVADRGLNTEVRLAGATALRELLRPEDASVLIDVLEDRTSPPRLQVALLGTLQRMIDELSGDERAALARVLLVQTAADDVNLKRRAFALFADPKLTIELDDEQLGRLVDRLALEPTPELRLALLELLSGSARPLVARDLITSDAFDALADETASLAALLDVLRNGTEAAPLPRFEAARRLARSSSGSTSAARLQGALQLVAELSAERAASFPPDAHRETIAWALDLRDQGLHPQDAVPAGKEFLERLWDVHLEAAEEQATEEEANGDPAANRRAFELRRARALFAVDLLAIAPEERRPKAARTAFADALALPADAVPLEDRLRLGRDHARFLLSLGDSGRADALEAYREVLTAERARGGHEVLEASDLRAIAGLFGGRDGSTEVDLRSALEVGAELVQLDAWRREPATVRVDDLRRMVEWATEARDRAALETLVPWLTPRAADDPKASTSLVGDLEEAVAEAAAALLDEAKAALEATGDPGDSGDAPTEEVPESGSDTDAGSRDEDAADGAGTDGGAKD